MESIPILGLWASKDKNGNSMMSGKLNDKLKVFVFKNTHKTQENHPDYILKIAPIEKEEKKAAAAIEPELPF